MEKNSKISAREFEQKVFELEEVVIRLRCNPTEEVEDYDYARQASSNTSISDWLQSRIIPKIGSNECDIIDGETYSRPHGRTRMEKLRDSYV